MIFAITKLNPQLIQLFSEIFLIIDPFFFSAPTPRTTYLGLFFALLPLEVS
jgi:hypothetical protein